MATIYVLQGPDKGRQFDVTSEDMVPLGRGSYLVPLTDLTVSRKHARLERNNETWVVHDEGAANGVFINGMRVTRSSKVKVGDQIRLGSTLLVFQQPRQNVKLTESEEIRLAPDSAMGDSSIISTIPGNDDSVVLAAPEPSAAAMAHFKVLLRISTAISSIFESDRLLNTVMDLVFTHLKADRGFIALTGPGDRVVPTVVRYRAEEADGKIAVSQTIIRHVLSKNEGVLSSNAMADQRFSRGKSVHNLAIRSAICVPLKGRESILGVLHIDTSVANFSYTADQLRLLTAIGMQTGLALENARLYQESMQRERLAATGQTVASLSHSIKNILQGIRGGGDVVELGLKKDNIEQVRVGWNILERNLDKVQTLTMNMLAYSKSRRPVYEMTHVPHVLNECLELIKPAAADRKLTLLTEINENQPPVPLDADGIHQAVLNLLGNAVDAVEMNRGIITLNSDVDAVNQQAIIEVQDNGVGIAPGDMDKIFVPFHSTKGQKGTGLGLAVTRKIIEEHGGKIEILSKLNHGTTFRIRLPLTRGASLDSQQTQGPGI